MLCYQTPRKQLSHLKADIRRRYGRPSVNDSSGTVLPKDKLIFYSNSRKRLMRYKELVSTFLGEEAYSFDVIIVHGSLFREQTFHNIQTFCMQQHLSTMDPVLANRFCLRLGYFFPWPALLELVLIMPTLHYLIQEGGRPAQYHRALPSDNRYHGNISWQSFCSLFFWIYVAPLAD